MYCTMRKLVYYVLIILFLHPLHSTLFNSSIYIYILHPTLYSTLLYSTVLYSTLPHSTPLYAIYVYSYPVPNSTLLYYTLL